MPQGNTNGQKPDIQTTFIVDYAWLEGHGIFHNRMDCQRKRAAGFPPPLQLSPNRIGWYLHEVNAWLESRPRRIAAAESGRSDDP